MASCSLLTWGLLVHLPCPHEEGTARHRLVSCFIRLLSSSALTYLENAAAMTDELFLGVEGETLETVADVDHPMARQTHLHNHHHLRWCQRQTHHTNTRRREGKTRKWSSAIMGHWSRTCGLWRNARASAWPIIALVESGPGCH
jgi:ABC-type nickel/cobalt efflux system permease component RcnA